MVRSLVISPHEDMRTWLKYASLCGKSGRLVSICKELLHIFFLFFFFPDPDRCRVNYNPITFRKDKSEMIEISLVRRRKMEVELRQR